VNALPADALDRPDVAVIRQVLRESLAYLYPAALRVVATLRIADHLADGPKTAERLAELTGAHPSHLRRVLRLLATRGVGTEDEVGNFHRTPAFDLLRDDSPLPLRSTVLLFTDELYWRPAGRLDETVRAGETIFPDIFGAQFFQHLAGDDDRARLFDAAIATVSATEQSAIAGSYDFPERGTVVDVAGGTGGFLGAVLRKNPGLHGVLVDREPVLSGHRLDVPELAGRWETEEGDFFVSLPTGGDFYVLKRIIHDKSEDECRRILRTVRAAMSDGARLLLVDAVVPPDNPSPSVILADVLMMTVFEGRERTEDEFRDLLGEAGLKLTRVIPTPSALSIIECVRS